MPFSVKTKKCFQYFNLTNIRSSLNILKNSSYSDLYVGSKMSKKAQHTHTHTRARAV